jgi:hypothetical protein
MPRQTQRRDAPMTSSLITEAREHIAYIGGEWPRDVKRPDWIRATARATGLTKSAVERLLYGKRKRIWADELLTLRARREALQESRARGETAYAELVARADALGCAQPVAGAAQSPGRGEPAPRGGGSDHRDAAAVVAAGQSLVRPNDGRG